MTSDEDLHIASRDSASIFNAHYKAGLRDGLADLRNGPEYTQKAFDLGFSLEFVRSLHLNFMLGYLEV